MAQVLLNGAEPVPITTLGSLSSCGMTKPEKCSLVCLCHTPPSSSCIFNIHERFQRISLRISGVPFPLSGILREMLLSFLPFSSHAQSNDASRDSGVDDVATIVACVVPASNVVALAFFAG